jgi:hypothetical protein
MRISSSLMLARNSRLSDLRLMTTTSSTNISAAAERMRRHRQRKRTWSLADAFFPNWLTLLVMQQGTISLWRLVAYVASAAQTASSCTKKRILRQAPPEA